MKKVVFFTFMVFAMTHAQENDSCNCCLEEQRAFDFWIGEWKVVNYGDGKPAGTSTIMKEEGGCVIRENWTSANAGYTGTSLNFYNKDIQQWEQLWVDNTGSHLKLKGNRKGDQMILVSDEFAKDDGKKYHNRIIWTQNSDGTVRQLWEVLQGEKVVSTAFDGLYQKQ